MTDSAFRCVLSSFTFILANFERGYSCRMHMNTAKRDISINKFIISHDRKRVFNVCSDLFHTQHAGLIHFISLTRMNERRSIILLYRDEVFEELENPFSPSSISSSEARSLHRSGTRFFLPRVDHHSFWCRCSMIATTSRHQTRSIVKREAV